MNAEPIISSLKNENIFLTDVKTSNHEFQIDEPEQVGGTDKAADPVEFALGALGACTAMTLKMYYDHKKLPWEQIDVHVRSELRKIDKETASDELKAMANNGKVRYVEKIIYITADMEEKMIERASMIAEKCPVNLMMKNGCHMETIVKRS